METFASGLKKIKTLCTEAGVRYAFQKEAYGFTVVFYRHCGEGWGWSGDQTSIQSATQSANGTENGTLNGTLSPSDASPCLKDASPCLHAAVRADDAGGGALQVIRQSDGDFFGEN